MATRSLLNFLSLTTSYIFSRASCFSAVYVFPRFSHLLDFSHWPRSAREMISRAWERIRFCASSTFVVCDAVTGPCDYITISSQPVQNYQNSGKKISLPNLFKFVLLVSRKGKWALLCTRRFHNKKFQLYLCAQRRGGSVAGSASLGLVENECWRCGRLDAWWFLGTVTGWGNVIQWCFRQISPVLHGDEMNAIFELKASQSVLICKRSRKHT